MSWRHFMNKAFWINLRQILSVILGSVIVALSLNSLVISNHIADGGVTGIAIILHYIFSWPVGLVIFIMNIPLFILGLKIAGRKFLLLSILAVSALSLTLQLTGGIPTITHEQLLASIFGGVLTGIGMGIVFRAQGSLGGTDILAVYLSRTTRFSVGQILLGIDALLFISAAFIFGAEIAMYAMIYMFVATRVVDLIQEGLGHSKSVFVVTSNPEGISREIMRKLERGVTLLQAVGGYSGEAKQVVYCVINRTELTQVKEIIRSQDASAFLTISDVPEVVGEGFSSWKGH